MRDEEYRNPKNKRTSEPEKAREDQEEIEAVTRTINVIAGGFAGGGMTKSACKKTPPGSLELAIRKDEEDAQAIIHPKDCILGYRS